MQIILHVREGLGMGERLGIMLAGVPPLASTKGKPRILQRLFQNLRLLGAERLLRVFSCIISS